MNTTARLLALSLVTLTAAAGDWPRWRGPDGTGVSPEKDLPLNWSASQNVRWRVDLPGPGNSSPIVWGDRVFVAQAIGSENRRTLMCFERAGGKLLWQSGVTYTEKEATQQNNPYCSATPVTDGELVIASFGSAGLYCYDFTGKELWRRDLGRMSNMFGNAASPVLHRGLCILNFGPDEKARLIAVDKHTGNTVWEVAPPKVDPSELQPQGGGPRGGGPGGPGGRGGFGPGTSLAPQILSQADTNDDMRLSRDELATLATTWFDKLDTEKQGTLSEAQFVERFGAMFAPPQGGGPPGQRPAGVPPPPPEGGRGSGPGPSVAPGLFTATDKDKNGSLSKAEFSGAFAIWFDEWDTGKTGLLNEERLRDGLSAALPQPATGGPGGPGEGRGPGGRGGGPGGGRDPATGATWSTPIVIATGGHEELIMSFPCRLAAYDPRTGKELWLSKGTGASIYASPVWGEDILIAMSSGPMGSSVIAVRPGGTGDVTENQRRWRLERIRSRIGSGVSHDGHFYSVSQEGIAECIDLKTGKTVWEKRLRGRGSRSSSWSSALLAGDRIFVPNQSGDVFVLRASPVCEVLAINSVGEPTNASLAASNGELFMRTDKALWCFSTAR